MTDAQTGNGPTGRGSRRGSRRIIPSRFDWATGWIQAFVAILTLALGIITAWGLFGTRDGGATATPVGPTASPGPGEVEPALLFEGWEEVSGDLILFGSFENVNLTAEEILLLGQPPDDPDAPFVPVRAQTDAQFTFPVDLANGDWRAVRPEQYAGLGWRAVVWPRSLGSGDAFAELREHGPEAEDVQAVSEVVVPED